MVGRSRYQLALDRTVSPQLVQAGSASQVHLELVNEGRGRTGVMLLEETLPFSLGSPPRFVLGRLPAGARRAVTSQLRSGAPRRLLTGPPPGPQPHPLGLP